MNKSATKISVLGVLLAGLLSGFATAGPAAADVSQPPAPRVAAEVDTDRSAERVVAPINTAVVTVGNTGNASASITLWRWTSAGWVDEKTGRTNASGGVTFRYVRGGAYYSWTTAKAAGRLDADGVLRTCYFYSQSNPAGVWVARGATRNIAFYSAWNTCGV